jgi:4-amino-4-deoxy-L-arabinose transferase-like glycosyltransferase
MDPVPAGDRRLLLAAALCAFLVYQVFNFLYLPAEWHFPDEDRFYVSAKRFAETGEFWIFNYRQWDMPGPTLLWSAVVRVFPGEASFIRAVRVVQSLLLLLSAFGVYRLSRLLFRNRLAALAAYLGTLFYPFFIYYQGLVLTETLFIVFLVWGFVFLHAWATEDTARWRAFLLAMLLLTLSVYVKATLTFLPVVLAPFFYWLHTRNLRRTALVLLASAACYGAIMAPWWVRSYRLFGQVVFFTSTSSMNMYLGNNPGNTTGGCDWATDAEERLYSTDEIPEIEYMTIYTERTKRFIRENPGHFLHLVWLKFLRFWNVVPNHERFARGIYAVLSLLSYGVTLVLAIAAAVIYRHRWRDFAAIYALIAYFTLVHTVTIASIRYRLPLEPFLIVLAGGCVAHLVERSRLRRRPENR